MSTGIIYGRVSTAEQKLRQTIRGQLTEVRAIAKRHEITVLREVTDDGRSGSYLEGRDLAGVIDQIEAGKLKVDFIVARHTDRLSRPDDGDYRSEADALRVKCALQAKGIRILTADGIRDPADIIQSAVEGALTRQEKARIKHRTREGRKQKARDGFWPWSDAPYGYRRERTRGGVTLVPDEAQANIIRKVYELVCIHGYRPAAKQCDRLGLPLPPHRGGKRKASGEQPTTWNPTHIYTLCKRASWYLGEVPIDAHGVRGTVQVEPIITADLYRRLRVEIEDRKHRRKSVMMLTGLARCECGERIEYTSAVWNGQPHFYLRCKTCHVHLRADRIEPWIWASARMRAIHMAQGAPGHSEAEQIRARGEKARVELADVVAEQGRLVRSIAKGTLTDDEAAQTMALARSQRVILEAEIKSLERRAAEAVARQAAERDAITAMLADAGRMGTVTDPAERRELVRRILAGQMITMRLNKDPEGVRLTWPEAGSVPAWTATPTAQAEKALSTGSKGTEAQNEVERRFREAAEQAGLKVLGRAVDAKGRVVLTTTIPDD